MSIPDWAPQDGLRALLDRATDLKELSQDESSESYTSSAQQGYGFQGSGGGAGTDLENAAWASDRQVRQYTGTSSDMDLHTSQFPLDLSDAGGGGEQTMDWQQPFDLFGSLDPPGVAQNAFLADMNMDEPSRSGSSPVAPPASAPPSVSFHGQHMHQFQGLPSQPQNFNQPEVSTYQSLPHEPEFDFRPFSGQENDLLPVPQAIQDAAWYQLPQNAASVTQESLYQSVQPLTHGLASHSTQHQYGEQPQHALVAQYPAHPSHLTSQHLPYYVPPAAPDTRAPQPSGHSDGLYLMAGLDLSKREGVSASPASQDVSKSQDRRPRKRVRFDESRLEAQEKGRKELVGFTWHVRPPGYVPGSMAASATPDVRDRAQAGTQAWTFASASAPSASSHDFNSDTSWALNSNQPSNRTTAFNSTTGSSDLLNGCEQGSAQSRWSTAVPEDDRGKTRTQATYPLRQPQMPSIPQGDDWLLWAQQMDARGHPLPAQHVQHSQYGGSLPSLPQQSNFEQLQHQMQAPADWSTQYHPGHSHPQPKPQARTPSGGIVAGWRPPTETQTARNGLATIQEAPAQPSFASQGASSSSVPSPSRVQSSTPRPSDDIGVETRSGASTSVPAPYNARPPPRGPPLMVRTERWLTMSPEERKVFRKEGSKGLEELKQRKKKYEKERRRAEKGKGKADDKGKEKEVVEEMEEGVMVS